MLRMTADERCIGGFRNPAYNNHRLPQIVSAGASIWELIHDTWKAFPGLQRDTLRRISNKNAPDLDLGPVRLFWGSRLGVSDASGVATTHCTSELRCSLLGAIVDMAADLDRATVEWLVNGGILENI